jgi:sugar/nucleoside kinase (ribokinase family)
MKNKDLSIALAELEEKFREQTVIAGFDGFIDEIIHIVDRYLDKVNYERIETISDFAGKINQAAGLSTNFEYKTMQKKLGGNGPILGNALLSQGNKLHYIGALGKTTIDPIFADFADKCETVVSIADPGYTEALEFSDGKLMMGRVDCLNEMNWENIVNFYGNETQLGELITTADLLCCTNWTNLYKMNSILIGMRSMNITGRIPLFIDLADPRKRTDCDIQEVLTIISSLEEKYEVILGLNEKESIHLAELLNVSNDDTLLRSRVLREKLDISCVVIHPVKYAVASTRKESEYAEGPYCEHPKLSTGAGDNFNAGFCCGWINGLSLRSALYTGTCTSGYYVRQMGSPTMPELKEFMSAWQENKI